MGLRCFIHSSELCVVCLPEKCAWGCVFFIAAPINVPYRCVYRCQTKFCLPCILCVPLPFYSFRLSSILFSSFFLRSVRYMGGFFLKHCLLFVCLEAVLSVRGCGIHFLHFVENVIN
ncbi:hypothetical protein, unlikely [Trypanosoma congolense IL3000]|uniref:Uncharacterized protein n=1 Tax=Trypanosoma congolense (strain IL3000) TaxID=1068625 RepID=F9W7X8_TRYCI|nr:hypothetical protein, unlikely [Trypanosoma congolense IL3000]